MAPIKVSDEDIEERRKEYATALRTETQASPTVRRAWLKMVAMFDELLERRRGSDGAFVHDKRSRS